MAHCLVTGAAGFIGSHLSRRLLAEGHRVTAVDSFTDYYPRSQKEANVADLRSHPAFTFVEGDLLSLPLPELLSGAAWVFHQAAQAGVRASWGSHFRAYTDNNVLATQVLLEACVVARPEKIVYASSSSVYGDAARLPASEDDLPRPVSPYGVTKLAAEHLCRLYWKNHGLPTVSLRYFTVYGPGQRPDMAFHRFLRAMIEDRPFEVYGDGTQTRDFTFIDDAVEANLRAAERGRDGGVYNIGGGHRMALRDVIGVMEEVAGRRARVDYRETERGDVRDTHADTTRARADLDYRPARALADGIRAEYLWLRDLVAATT
jgi:UDP-glucose 4-epimerase